MSVLRMLWLIHIYNCSFRPYLSILNTGIAIEENPRLRHGHFPPLMVFLLLFHTHCHFPSFLLAFSSTLTIIPCLSKMSNVEVLS